jgi:hypothetical protein
VTVLQQVLRHAEAHRAQSDERDDGCVLVGHGSGLDAVLGGDFPTA